MRDERLGSRPDEAAKVIFSEDSVPEWPGRDPTVRKVILGEPPIGREKKHLRIASLPADLASRLPGLLHLYLWQITELTKLPDLPAGLKCLDVRGCADLTELPALPGTLETLDLGRCAGLRLLPREGPSALKRLYFDGCTGLEDYSLAGFLEELVRRGASVEEVDGSGSAAVVSLARFPNKSLRKLVLEGCQRLTDLSQISTFPALEHLNLTDCTEFESLPDLPPQLKYLVLHGAVKLRLFMGQDVGPYDRGQENQNVAKAFLSRKKFGNELAIMPHAKLLLMGDGRVGKTTLAKRLQWGELAGTQRGLPASKDLEPSPNEPFTHKVRFWHWKTDLSLPEMEAKALDERVKAAGITLSGLTEGHLDGAVRIWDFGGQEIYHSTHRIFAGEGSIFLVVWRESQPDPGPAPEGAREYWDEWNRQRPLDYWLDYIYSIRPTAKVALVCTNCQDPDTMARKPDWRARAPKHAHRDLPTFFVNSLDPRCASHVQYQRLVSWIREACGQEAKRIGILQPRFYRDVSDLLDRWLAGNSEARLSRSGAKRLLFTWKRWQDEVKTAHREAGKGPGPDLVEDDVVAITDYLHQAGQLFRVRHEGSRAVLVDQEWAAELIYRLLSCEGQLWNTVRANGGWFHRADLEADPYWKALDDDLQRERLLSYMQECRVVTRISEARKNYLGEDVFLALNKWLLPEYAGELETTVDRRMRQVRDQTGVVERERFEFEDLKLSELDFRSLQAQLARTFGTRAIYFRNGLQALDKDASPDSCFRLRWKPGTKDSYEGKVDAVLLAPRSLVDRLAEEIEDLCYAEGSPLAHRRRSVRRTRADEGDLRPEYFRLLGGDAYDLAVSSSSEDRAEAEAMVQALKAAGLKVNWYLLPGCRANERERLLEFMHSLGRAPRIVLLISAGFLRNDPANNWYCAWELADAIRRLRDDSGGRDQPEIRWPDVRRTAEQTLVVFKESGGFRFAQFGGVASRLIEGMAEHFHQEYGALRAANTERFCHYDEFSRHFTAAVRPEVWSRFMDVRGALGGAISYATAAGPTGDFSPLRALYEKGAAEPDREWTSSSVPQKHVSDVMQEVVRDPGRGSLASARVEESGVAVRPESEDPGPRVERVTPGRRETDPVVDVVILTAITLEYNAVKSVEAGFWPGAAWREEMIPSSGLPIAFGTYRGHGDRPLRIAVTTAGEMGALNAAMRLSPLVEKYRPTCVAMAGVCAGRPEKTNLGDVIAAERLFLHDTGKQRPDGAQQDIKTYNLSAGWKVAIESFEFASRFRSTDWFGARPIPRKWQEDWLLAQLRAGVEDPSAMPEHERFCPQYESVIEQLWRTGEIEDGTCRISETGRSRIERLLIKHKSRIPDLSPSGTVLPFRVHVAPMGSGNRVVEDKEIWGFVSEHMRKTLGLDMEAAVVGAVANEMREHRSSLVMKGVMDFADHGRDDHFKEFAARAAAECLIAFLRVQLETKAELEEDGSGPAAANPTRGGDPLTTPRRGGRQ